jgi:prepilin-type N-terminal cleavage/methylation domain-containing protein
VTGPDPPPPTPLSFILPSMRVPRMFPAPKPRTSVSGFTLIELVMVMAIMLMVLGFAAPSVVGILKGKKIEQALSTVTGVLEQARMDAATQNTYLWTGFMNVAARDSKSGVDELWMMTFRGRSGENRIPTNAEDVLPVSTLQRVEGVNMVEVDKLPDRVKALLPVTYKDVASSPKSQAKLTWKGTAATGTREFDRILLFTPRGEALWETGSPKELPLSEPNFVVGLSRTQNGNVAPNEKDMAVVLVAGVTGRVSVGRP